MLTFHQLGSTCILMVLTCRNNIATIMHKICSVLPLPSQLPHVPSSCTPLSACLSASHSIWRAMEGIWFLPVTFCAFCVIRGPKCLSFLFLSHCLHGVLFPHPSSPQGTRSLPRPAKVPTSKIVSGILMLFSQLPFQPLHPLSLPHSFPLPSSDLPQAFLSSPFQYSSSIASFLSLIFLFLVATSLTPLFPIPSHFPPLHLSLHAPSLIPLLYLPFLPNQRHKRTHHHYRHCDCHPFAAMVCSPLLLSPSKHESS